MVSDPHELKPGGIPGKVWGSVSSPIGIVGIGKIGAEIARRITEAGHTTVLYNRSREKAEALGSEIGAKVAATLGDVASTCDLVLNVVTDWEAVQKIYTSPEGLLSACRQSSVFVELSTLGPALIGQLYEIVSESDANLVDATITGRPSDIAQGSGLIMAGGDTVTVDRLAPVLSAIGEVRHTGAIGSGSAMKLAVNLLLFSTLCGISEALNIAEKAGIDRGTAYDLLIASPLNSKVLQFRREDFVNPQSASIQAALGLVTKDLGLIADLAERNDALIPQTLRTRQIFAAAEAGGYGARDATAIAEFLRSSRAANLIGEE